VVVEARLLFGLICSSTLQSGPAVTAGYRTADEVTATLP
jgi:hypothetical protein